MKHRNVLAWMLLMLIASCVGANTCDQITLKIQPELPVVHEGHVIELTCIAECKDAASLKLTWYNDTSVPLDLGGHNTVVSHVRAEMKIQIKAQKWDNGVPLRCLAESLYTKNATQVKLNVTYKPYFTFKTKPEVVEEGKDVTAYCQVDSNPPTDTYEWSNINRDFTINSPDFSLPGSDRSRLHQEYICTVEYLGTKYPMSFHFNVSAPPKMKAIYPNYREEKVGDELSVLCEAEGNPQPHSIFWTKLEDPNFLIESSKLVLNNIQPSSVGRYICYATNRYNNQNYNSSVSFYLRVRYPPGKSSIDLSEVVIWPGQQATITCTADPPGWPQPRFRWTKQSSFNYALTEESQLTISGTKSGDTVYVCQAFNSQGNAQSAYVTVTVLPVPKLVQLRSEWIVPIGEVNFQVFCSVQGRTVEPILWLKNGHVIQDNDSAYEIISDRTPDGRLVTLNSSLIFRGPQRPSGTQITFQDAGNYTCILKNDYNYTESMMQLFVQYKFDSKTGDYTTQPPRTTYHAQTPAVEPVPRSYWLLFVIVGLGALVSLLIIVGTAWYLWRTRRPRSSSISEDKVPLQETPQNCTLSKNTEENESFKIYVTLSPSTSRPNRSKQAFQ